MIEIRKPQFSFFFSIVMAVSLVLGASTRIQAGASRTISAHRAGRRKSRELIPQQSPRLRITKACALE
jgi:hypothetical protein